MAADPISAGLMIAGQVAGAVGQHREGLAASRADVENARRTELQGALDQQALIARERATSGEAIAAQGGGGLAVGTGSAWDLLYQNALERERAVMASRFTTGGQAQSLRDKAASERAGAKWALVSGIAGAGAKALALAGDSRDRAARGATSTATVPGGWTMPLPGPLPATRADGVLPPGAVPVLRPATGGGSWGGAW